MTIKEKQPFCEGDTILMFSNSILKPQYPKATYLWTDPVNSAISPLTNLNLNVLAKKTTDYYRTITNGACVRKDTFKMTVLPIIKPLGLKDTAVCDGVKVQLNITNAKDYDSFAWSPTTGLSCKDCPNPIVSAAGTYTVKATVKGKCPAETSVKIVYKNKPLVVTPSNSTVCQGQAVNVPLTMISTGVTNLKWSPSAGLSCDNCATPTATKLGNYTVSGIIDGCESKGSATISEIDTTINITANGKICDLDVVQLDIVNVNLFSAFTWSSSANLSCTNCASPTTTKTGTYFVKATKNGKCKSTGKVEVLLSNNPKQILVTPALTEICDGQKINVPITIGTTGLTGITWSPSLTNPNPVATAYGKYTITGKVNNGLCEAKGEVSINKIDTVMNASVDGKICDDKTATISIANTTDYKNYKITPATINSGFTTKTPGIYTIKAVTIKGSCSTTAKVTVESGSTSAITIAASPSQLLLPDQEVTLTVKGDANFDANKIDWNTGAKGAVLTEIPKIDSVKTYTVTALSKDNCTSKSSINVYVVKAPLVITPETNDLNNVFKLIQFPFQVADIQEVTVINRWGEVVYTAAKDGWRGNYESRNGSGTTSTLDFVPTDVYIYYVKAKMKNGGNIAVLKGEITVLR